MRCKMNYLNKLERKIGKYAIPNLSLWLVVTYALGYLMMYMTPGDHQLSDVRTGHGAAWSGVATGYMGIDPTVYRQHLFLYYYDHAVLFLRNRIRAYLGNFPL